MFDFKKFVAVSTIATVMSCGLALAQDHHDDYHHDDYHHDDQRHYDNNHYVHHNDWVRGHRMNRNDWQRGQRVDYRRYRLNAPPRGYEWRQVDGNFVLGAIATGLIASVIVASASH
jgi:Ni/Co efflux regulator RcnB